MHPSARAVSFSLLLAACAASQDRPPESVPAAAVSVPIAAPSAPAPASASASAASVPRLPPLPPAVDEVTGAVCSYRSSGESSVRAELFLPGKEKPFATVWAPTVAVALPPSEQARPVVEATSAHLKIRAQTRVEAMSFYAQTLLVMGGVMVPSGHETLRVSRVGSGDLTVRWTPSFSGVTLTPTQQERSVACGDLGLESSKLDSRDAVPDISKARPVALKGGQTFALRASEKGDPVVEIRTPKKPSPAKNKGPRAIAVDSVFTPQTWVVKTSGAQSLLVLLSSGNGLFGWVPSAALEPPANTSLGSLFGMAGLGSLMGAAEPAPRENRVLCEAEIPLLGEQEGTRVTLGSLRSKVCMNLREQGADFSRVAVYNLDLKTTESSRLLVPTAALAGCHPVPTEGALPRPCEGLASDETQDFWGGIGLGTGGLGNGVGGLGSRKGNGSGLGGSSAKPGKDKGPQPGKK